MSEKAPEIGIEDFMKVDVRVGTIIDVQDYPEARKPAYKLWIDFGEEIGTKKTSAQCTANYSKDDLMGRQVAAVVNFPPRQIGKFMSEVLTLGFPVPMARSCSLPWSGPFPTAAGFTELSRTREASEEGRQMHRASRLACRRRTRATGRCGPLGRAVGG